MILIIYLFKRLRNQFRSIQNYSSTLLELKYCINKDYEYVNNNKVN